MVAFDAPNREVCTVRRGTTNTPLQALVTMNDPVYIEAAQSLARKMVSSGKSVAEQISTGFEICLSRKPDASELKRLVELFEQVKKKYSEDESLALQMATEPIGPVPNGMNATDLAALTVTCNVLLNLDEILMKR
jgi:pyruvate/oxaloacetate carboxyltransferase